MYMNNGVETKNCNYVIHRKSHYLLMGQFVNSYFRILRMIVNIWIHVAFFNWIHTSNRGMWVPLRIYFLFLMARSSSI